MAEIHVNDRARQVIVRINMMNTYRRYEGLRYLSSVYMLIVCHLLELAKFRSISWPSKRTPVFNLSTGVFNVAQLFAAVTFLLVSCLGRGTDFGPDKFAV